MGLRMRLNVVQHSGLVGLGYGVGFNLNGGLWDVTSGSNSGGNMILELEL